MNKCYKDGVRSHGVHLSSQHLSRARLMNSIVLENEIYQPS